MNFLSDVAFGDVISRPDAFRRPPLELKCLKMKIAAATLASMVLIIKYVKQR